MSEIQPLSPKQTRAINALLQCGSVAEAARFAHCTRGSLYRWMTDPTFCDALAKAQRDAYESLARNMAGLGSLSGDTLRRAMTEKSVPWPSRLRAVELALTHFERTKETLEILSRLDALERGSGIVN